MADGGGGGGGGGSLKYNSPKRGTKLEFKTRFISRSSTTKNIKEFVFHISTSIAPARTILLIISSLIRTQMAFDYPLPPHLAEKRLDQEDWSRRANKVVNAKSKSGKMNLVKWISWRHALLITPRKNRFCANLQPLYLLCALLSSASRNLILFGDTLQRYCVTPFKVFVDL